MYSGGQIRSCLQWSGSVWSPGGLESPQRLERLTPLWNQEKWRRHVRMCHSCEGEGKEGYFTGPKSKLVSLLFLVCLKKVWVWIYLLEPLRLLHCAVESTKVDTVCGDEHPPSSQRGEVSCGGSTSCSFWSVSESPSPNWNISNICQWRQNRVRAAYGWAGNIGENWRNPQTDCPETLLHQLEMIMTPVVGDYAVGTLPFRGATSRKAGLLRSTPVFQIVT